MGAVVWYEHHGRMVATDAEDKGRYGEHCLCWRCAKFHPNTPDNCSIAQALYELDCRHGVTTPVWECPQYQEK
jgi:hypothetical protein